MSLGNWWFECRQRCESAQFQVMILDEMVDFCRSCHRLAPFIHYNGDTFAAITSASINSSGFPVDRAAVARSLAGHIVAGVASEEEIKAFKKFCASFG